jgi:DNA-binding MarR family transcriptional regulator
MWRPAGQQATITQPFAAAAASRVRSPASLVRTRYHVVRQAMAGFSWPGVRHGRFWSAVTVVRALVALGPSSIRDLARAISVTHSAASQTVAQMSRRGLVTVTAGADARQRIVRLTAKTESMLPTIEAEWAVTEEAMRELEAELPFPLAETLAAILRAVERRSLRQRLGDAARACTDPAMAAVLAAADRPAR